MGVELKELSGLHHPSLLKKAQNIITTQLTITKLIEGH